MKRKNILSLMIGAALILGVLFGAMACGSGGGNNSGSNGTPKPAATNANKTTIPANAPQGANPPNSFGSPTAAVTLEEFADFQCPMCGAKHPIMEEIKSMYGSRIHFIFRNFPLSIPAHDKAYEAAVAAEAAGMQGKFWDMQNILYRNQQAWTASPTYKQMWKDYATKIGLDVEKWETDRTGIAAKGRVDADLTRGRSIGVGSTPSLYLNNQAFPFEQMTVEGLKAAIDAELAKAGNKTAAAPAANNANTSESK